MTTKRKLASVAVLTAAYFVTGKLGLTLAYVHPSATAVWPPAGIALAALLIFGCELWPAILLGAFLVNITTDGSALVCAGIAVGNTLEAITGAWLVNRYARGRNAIYSTPDVFKFALLAGLICTALSATAGVTSLELGGVASWSSYRAIWTTWWLGDAAGVMLVAPLLLAWIGRPRLRWRRNQYFEGAALLATLVFTGLVVFDGLFGVAAKNYPIEYACMPFLLWVAYRFGTREATAATVVLAGTAIWGTLQGYGPFGGAPFAGAIFGRSSHNESLLLLQAFVSVFGVTTIGLASAFAERRIAEEQSHFLAVSDPLTGLGNYRKLIDTLEMEMHRSSRTGRPFALLLLDMDELKRINDTFGHVVGSRALCRLAAALRIYSRNIDTPARYGGDEFALIIPELSADLGREIWQDDDSIPGRKLRVKIQADDVIVQHVAWRIADRLANDGEFPRLSVSIGAAQFPADGENIEQLLNVADQALYRNKRAKKNPISPPFAAPPSQPHEGASASATALASPTASPRNTVARNEARTHLASEPVKHSP